VRKTHIPQVAGFWRSSSSSRAIPAIRCSRRATAKLGVYICYDRHFPEGWRALALHGAEYIVNPSATVAGLSEHLWKLEQPASAVANGVYIGAVNRIGTEGPWNIGEFYGQSYFVNPRGIIEAIASRDKDELLVHDMDLDLIRKTRDTWQFLPRSPAGDLSLAERRRVVRHDSRWIHGDESTALLAIVKPFRTRAPRNRKTRRSVMRPV